MKWIRKILCKMDIRHRLTKAWLPMAALGVTDETAFIWGCEIKGPTASCYVCRDCGSVLAPFEVQARGWHES